MSDQNSPENPDTTPTESIELTDQLPAVLEQPSVADSAPKESGRSHTRTILEIVGGVVAAGLIVVAGAGGFVAGLAVGDSDGGRHGGPQAGESWQQMPDGDQGRGFYEDGMGRGEGRGFYEDGMGRGEGRGFNEDGMGQEMTPDQMLERFIEEFGPEAGIAPDSAPSS